MEQNREGPLLQINGISVSYGQITALEGASIEVFSGEIVVLVGANGAGKTTLLETVLGINQVAAGDIFFGGRSISRQSADKNVRNGLFLVPEGRGVFPSMTVVDNLLLGAHHNMKSSPRNMERVFEFFPILGERRDQTARTLSGGERQMLAFGRALMSNPKLILVDEPSIGLAPILVNEIFKIIVRLNETGYSILLSEQNAYKALKCSHRGYVLETGRVVLSGTSDELLNNRGVKEAYLGA